jgi:hypothetical protein
MERSDYQNRLRDEDSAELTRRREIADEQHEEHDDDYKPGQSLRRWRNDDAYCDCH